MYRNRENATRLKLKAEKPTALEEWSPEKRLAYGRVERRVTTAKGKNEQIQFFHKFFKVCGIIWMNDKTISCQELQYVQVYKFGTNL